MAQGKKTCPNCNTEIGARTQLCGCGYHFLSEKVRKDLLEEKDAAPKTKEHTSEGRGRKKCPECKVIVGVRTKICPCGYDYAAHSKVRAEEKEKEKREKKNGKEKEVKEVKMNPLTAELLAFVHQNPYEEPEIATKRDHAKRILSYGAERAKSLLLQHRIHSCWSHVDWDYVKEQVA